jgi:hypothetical protein
MYRLEREVKTYLVVFKGQIEWGKKERIKRIENK